MTSQETLERPSAGSPPERGSAWGRRARAALAGVLAAAAALGVAELIAGLVSPNSSPVVAVGGVVIDATPRPVKEFAISTFGESDKQALVVGTLVLILLFAIALGLASLRNRRLGLLGVAVFGLIGAAAAVTRPVGGILDALPSLIGAVVGMFALVAMIRPLTKDDPADDGPAQAPGPALDRRRFFIVSGVVAAAAAVAGGAGTILRRRFNVSAARSALRIAAPADSAPAVPAGADLADQVDGVTTLFTKNADFYRVDTAITVPQVSPTDWSLRIHGAVDHELTLSFADLNARDDLIERDITLTCVSNDVGGVYAGAARWIGVPLANLLKEAGVRDGADQVFTTSSDGWTCSTPTADCMSIENAMLAFSMNGEPLPVEHGFPVRMIVPGLYGYVSATKWIVDMELTSFVKQRSYWTDRGWDEQAPIKTFSRIDVPRSTGVKAGTVAIAGVAWAQGRGISKVEIAIDGGGWQPATLAPETNNQMWRQWSLPWDAAKGQHSLSVRSTDGTGQTQTEQRAAPFPNGASGWQTVQVFIQ